MISDEYVKSVIETVHPELANIDLTMVGKSDTSIQVGYRSELDSSLELSPLSLSFTKALC